jgi:general L-amino acid transport system permease protein
MDTGSVAYVRTEDAPQYAPPSTKTGAVGWIRDNLFDSVANSILTIVGIAILALIVPPVINWLFIDAVYTGDSRDACVVEGAGACWAFVNAKFGQFMYGRYPLEERWRVDLTGILLIAGLVPAAIPQVPFKRETVLYLIVVFPIAGFVLLTGGNVDVSAGFWMTYAALSAILLAIVAAVCVNAKIPLVRPLVGVAFAVVAVALVVEIAAFDFGLVYVETQLWGGLLVTLVVAIVGIVASFPLGIVLALGRRSQDADRSSCLDDLHRVLARRAADHRAVHVLGDAAAVPAGRRDLRQAARALIGVRCSPRPIWRKWCAAGFRRSRRGSTRRHAMGLTFWQGMR